MRGGWQILGSQCLSACFLVHIGEPDQSTHDAGSAKSTSASQSPDSVQPLGPASGDQTESCSSGHQHPNISFPNELICEDQVQHITPIIHLKEPRTCLPPPSGHSDVPELLSFPWSCTFGSRDGEDGKH
ncbi:hypothetical protein IHE44_0012660 [Lamprotornis superbus]|uniref:Uncharacterized protein n=1 Tax=Lamprotornis superbus TaxID=245042 RepID=A0A835TS21_9PASS|nr:hypothetical protein IHE44_0012660 [Lamprotornis superbus]